MPKITHSADQDPELFLGWEDASRGVRFKVFASRPWRQGWFLFTYRSHCRRHHERLQHSPMSVH